VKAADGAAAQLVTQVAYQPALQDLCISGCTAGTTSLGSAANPAKQHWQQQQQQLVCAAAVGGLPLLWLARIQAVTSSKWDWATSQHAAAGEALQDCVAAYAVTDASCSKEQLAGQA
jgi:hypothetical protein